MGPSPGRESGPLRGPIFSPPPAAKADLEIRIPQSIEYKIIRIMTSSGDVEVSNVEGRFWIINQRGKVDVKDMRGWITASTINGAINVSIEQAQKGSTMNFSSNSGNVEVVAPSNLNASIDMRSKSGLIKSDFPVEIKEIRYLGKYATAKLGKEPFLNLTISSTSGRVSLLRK